MHRTGFWIKRVRVSRCRSEWLSAPRGRLCERCSRQQLLDAALRIYARAGVGDLALNTLAEEAGVSNGTVYNYFRSREQVLKAVGLELAVQLSEQSSPSAKPWTAAPNASASPCAPS